MASIAYQQIENTLKELKQNKIGSPIEIGYQLLRAFGTTETYITRYKNGKGNLDKNGGILVKKMLAMHAVDTIDLTKELETMKADDQIRKNLARIIAVTDGDTIVAYDPKYGETFEDKVDGLWVNFEFFYPLAGVERNQIVDENAADVRAAEKLAKLHDEIRRFNDYNSGDDLHDLNVFMMRLLFCYFAEDTGIFSPNLFTNSIDRFTNENGTDLTEYLTACFDIMDVKQEDRKDIPRIVSQFPYVNGGLFKDKIAIPKLGRKARIIMIECGELDWEDINPDIFGSMIQAVVTPEMRGDLGIHYTSVPNIMKVIKPLFLDELNDEYELLNKAKSERRNLFDIGMTRKEAYFKDCEPIVKRCKSMLARMSKMKFFDPACGSGNFLIISYKQLRLLEMKILKLMHEMKSQQDLEFLDGSVISINQFYGIEISDFAHDTAILSLWLAEHQMNRKFRKDFGINIDALPLKTNTNIIQGNACRLDWNTVCPHEADDEVFVMGNPPYIGSRKQEQSNKDDMECVFHHDYKSLDYIASWFMKGAKFINSNNIKVAFVSTNSICQGLQVDLLWSRVFKFNLEIGFAYTSFKWNNNAKNQAAVIVIIVCMRMKSTKKKLLYTDNLVKKVSNISPYLTDNNDIIVSSTYESISGFPHISFGNMPADGGYLIFDENEKNDFIQKEPESKNYIKRFIGSEDFINDIKRYCLWLNHIDYSIIETMPYVMDRVNKVREVRLASSRPQLAETPQLFAQITQLEGYDYIIIPRVSSERREYIPIGLLDKENIIADSAFSIHDAQLWLFGILTSKMHVAWVKAVGGKLKSDYRYSATLCYNTFPFPEITDEKKEEINMAATEVLMARENHTEKTLAEMYDPDKMPKDLKEAHHKLDLIVDGCYRDKPFGSDEERLEKLFKQYEAMTNKE